ncbi:MAG: hypothetical protein ACI9HA_003061, partial [Dinoroseobacter sp.]
DFVIPRGRFAIALMLPLAGAYEGA